MHYGVIHTQLHYITISVVPFKCLRKERIKKPSPIRTDQMVWIVWDYFSKSVFHRSRSPKKKGLAKIIVPFLVLGKDWRYSHDMATNTQNQGHSWVLKMYVMSSYENAPSSKKRQNKYKAKKNKYKGKKLFLGSHINRLIHVDSPLT